MEFLDREGDCIQFSIDAVAGHLREFANGRLTLAPVPWIEYCATDGTLRTEAGTRCILEQGSRADVALGIRALAIRSGVAWRGDEPDLVRRLVLNDVVGFRLEFVRHEANILQMYYKGELMRSEVDTLIYSSTAGTLSDGTRVFLLAARGTTMPKVAVLRCLSEQAGVMWCGDDPLERPPPLGEGGALEAAGSRRRPIERCCGSRQDLVHLCTNAMERQEYAGRRRYVVYEQEPSPSSGSPFTPPVSGASSPPSIRLEAPESGATASPSCRLSSSASPASSFLLPLPREPTPPELATPEPVLERAGSAQLASAWIEQVVAASLDDVAGPMLAQQCAQADLVGLIDSDIAEVEAMDSDAVSLEGAWGGEAMRRHLLGSAMAPLPVPPEAPPAPPVPLEPPRLVVEPSGFAAKLPKPAEQPGLPAQLRRMESAAHAEEGLRWAWGAADAAPASLDVKELEDVRWAWADPMDAAAAAVALPPLMQGAACNEMLECTSPTDADAAAVLMEPPAARGCAELADQPSELEPTDPTDSDGAASEVVEEDVLFSIVRLDGSEVVKLSMRPNAVVHQVKQLVAVEAFVPVSQQRLVYDEVILQDDLKIGEAGIISGAFLLLVHARPPLRSRHPSKGAMTVGCTRRR